MNVVTKQQITGCLVLKQRWRLDFPEVDSGLMNRVHILLVMLQDPERPLQYRISVNSNLAKSRSPKTPISVAKSFWNFSQSTAVVLPCSVKNIITIWQLNYKLWTNEILRDFEEISYIAPSPRAVKNMEMARSNQGISLSLAAVRIGTRQ